MSTENIQVFFASDDKYASFLCVAMYSILKYTKSFVDFTILDNNIKEETKTLINESLKKFDNYSIDYISVSSLGLERFPDTHNCLGGAFSRCFIPQLREDVKKALYLDVDIIAKADIKELYDIDLEDSYAGVISEDFLGFAGKFLKEKMYPDFENPDNYFCSGVMLMNTQKMRENNITEKLVNTTLELKDKLIKTPDQSILNIVLENKVKYIDYKYNYYPDGNHYYIKKFGLERAKEIKNNAIIYHFTGGKPWYGLSSASNEFFSLAKETLFKDKIQKVYDDYMKKTFKKRMLQKLFSIKNEYDEFGNKVKCITVLGLKSKFNK
ncbi:glycosyltransferase family 8 protein [bacterium]|nr:glycosyltransferase family 8 protein [bacterium]